MDDKDASASKREDVIDPVSSVNDQTSSLGLHREGDVVLRDGSTVRVRQMRPSDEPALTALLTSLSEESRWLRFYSILSSSLAAEAHREANLDHSFALVACTGGDDRIVGHAFYASLNEQRAEVAFAVANDFQGRGTEPCLRVPVRPRLRQRC